ncbi:2OG-Fe(II) oxygenase [Bradyrhizobium jicamae]|uniref:2OG-Fe(II) oxygenase n=1 Tax=Bradyrhizobium jicamae TaxID=280332 RepID=A0ABS5FMX9_9BRAD|nr:2OG-Fe(II) oxygenase [Bradyrhizobium jicamae]MBR0798168.1 2OG-Fe(II) oxygenase [Bradyrhizobium jicamae]
MGGQLLALRIPHYFPPERSPELVEALKRRFKVNAYERATNLNRIGTPFVNARGNEAVRELYLASAPDFLRELRAVCNVCAWPIDRLRLEMDELWPAGSVTLKIDGRTCFVGLTRIFENGSFARPHQDSLRRDGPDLIIARSIKDQLAANIYLDKADAGGVLQLWSRRLPDDEYEAMKQAGGHGIDPESLGAPDAQIAPEVGDLILFRSSHLHAVSKIEGRPRVAASAFIGYWGAQEPLRFWS